MKKNYKILFFGRKNDIYSEKILCFLKKKFKNVSFFFSSKYVEKINKNIYSWKGDYILCFRSYLILPNKVIKNAQIAAINFHPGPPKYRGVGCLNYALYNDEKEYGVTAHIMNSKIDYGKILMVKRFKIKKNQTLDFILNQTHKYLYNIAMDFIKMIKNKSLNINKLSNKFKNEKWSRIIKKKKDLDNFYILKKNMSLNKFNKKLRATITEKYKPYFIINKRKRFVVR